MPDDSIQASVGMHANGTKKCFNVPVDVGTIVKLLNFSSSAEGGRNNNPLPSSASASDLFQAIFKFQKTQNDLGKTPRLSVDGHVDPRGNTLARLNRTARQIGPLGPNDGPFFGLDAPPLPEPVPELKSTDFKIRFLAGVNAGEGIVGDVLLFRFWDTTNNLGLKYTYTAIGGGVGPFPVSITAPGSFTAFTTPKPWTVDAFGGPAHWATVGESTVSLNILRIFFIAGLGRGVQIFVDTGVTIVAGASLTFGTLAPTGDVEPFNGHGI